MPEAVVLKCSVKKVSLKISQKPHQCFGKHLCQSLFFNKITGTFSFPQKTSGNFWFFDFVRVREGQKETLGRNELRGSHLNKRY